jgi:hypothetical protein
LLRKIAAAREGLESLPGTATLAGADTSGGNTAGAAAAFRGLEFGERNAEVFETRDTAGSGLAEINDAKLLRSRSGLISSATVVTQAFKL